MRPVWERVRSRGGWVVKPPGGTRDSVARRCATGMRAPPRSSSERRPLLAPEGRRTVLRRVQRSAVGLRTEDPTPGTGQLPLVFRDGRNTSATAGRQRSTSDTAQSHPTDWGPRPGIRGGTDARLSAVSSPPLRNASPWDWRNVRRPTASKQRLPHSAFFFRHTAPTPRQLRSTAHPSSVRRTTPLHSADFPPPDENPMSRLPRLFPLNIDRTPRVCRPASGFATQIYPQ